MSWIGTHAHCLCLQKTYSVCNGILVSLHAACEMHYTLYSCLYVWKGIYLIYLCNIYIFENLGGVSVGLIILLLINILYDHNIIIHICSFKSDCWLHCYTYMYYKLIMKFPVMICPLYFCASRKTPDLSMSYSHRSASTPRVAKTLCKKRWEQSCLVMMISMPPVRILSWWFILAKVGFIQDNGLYSSLTNILSTTIHTFSRWSDHL